MRLFNAYNQPLLSDNFTPIRSSKIAAKLRVSGIGHKYTGNSGRSMWVI